MGHIIAVILYAYQQSHGILLLLIAVLLLAWNRGRAMHAAIAWMPLWASAVGLGCVVIATYFAIMILRQVQFGYDDHLEALVASISWLVVVHGRPAFPDWHDGDLYGGIYGPLLFWINGVTLLVSPTIGATKLVAAGALVLGVGALLVLAARAVSPWSTRLLLAAILVEALIPYKFTAYWIRAEPFLYLISVLAILTALARRPALAIVLLGLLAGLAVDLKVHAVLYLLPAGLMVLAAARTVRQGLGLAALGALAAAAAFIAPVLADPSVVRLYRVYLPLATRHGFSGGAIIENLDIAAALAVPPLLLIWWRRPRLSKGEIWFACGLCIATPLIVLLGSKIGALPNYLLPLSPSFLYLTLRALAAPADRVEPAGACVGLAGTVFLILFACNLGSWLMMVEMFGYSSSAAALSSAKRAEFVALISAHPNAEMGAADVATYEDTYLEPLQVMRNNMLHVGIGAWMDLRAAGIGEAYAARFIENCAVPAWIIPNGAPFSVITPYGDRPLFSDEFRATFARNYEMVDRGRFYSVWNCRTDR